MIRVLIVFRTIFQDIFRTVHPRAITPLKMGDRILPEGVRVAVLGLFAAWVMVFVLATFLVAIQEDLTLFSSATPVTTSLNVVRPGLGQVGPSESYEAVNTFGRLVLTICMLFGVLEIFTALALLSPTFWRKQGGFRSNAARRFLRGSAKASTLFRGSNYCKTGGLH